MKGIIVMKEIQQFFNNTKNSLPHKNLKKFIEIENKTGQAIDLGCGAGKDTVFLIENDWNVTAIDRENTDKLIRENLNNEELKKYCFQCQNFENIQLEKNDLIVSNYSIPFCNKNYFNEFWKKIVNSIRPNRIFCWEFLWLK